MNLFTNHCVYSFSTRMDYEHAHMYVANFMQAIIMLQYKKSVALMRSIYYLDIKFLRW